MTKQQNKKTVKTAPKVKPPTCAMCKPGKILSRTLCIGCSRRLKKIHENHLATKDAFLLKCLLAKRYRDIESIYANYAQKMAADV